MCSNLITVLGSIDNITEVWGGRGDSYDHLMNMRIFTFVMNKIFIRAPVYVEFGYGPS